MLPSFQLLCPNSKIIISFPKSSSDFAFLQAFRKAQLFQQITENFDLSNANSIESEIPTISTFNSSKMDILPKSSLVDSTSLKPINFTSNETIILIFLAIFLASTFSLIVCVSFFRRFQPPTHISPIQVISNRHVDDASSRDVNAQSNPSSSQKPISMPKILSNPAVFLTKVRRMEVDSDSDSRETCSNS